MNIPDAITELGLLLGQPGLSLSDAGTCRLQFDGRIAVDFEAFPDGQTLHLSSPVSLLEMEDDDSLAEMLRASRLGALTGGGCFSLDPEGQILLERSLRMDQVDFTAFQREVESFVNHLDGWQERIAAGEMNPAG